MDIDSIFVDVLDVRTGTSQRFVGNNHVYIMGEGVVSELDHEVGALNDLIAY